MKTVLVVGADDMVALRTIQPGETVGDLLIVRDGVKPGERGDRRRGAEGPAGGQGQPDRCLRGQRTRSEGGREARKNPAEPKSAAKAGGK